MKKTKQDEKQLNFIVKSDIHRMINMLASRRNMTMVSWIRAVINQAIAEEIKYDQ